MSFTTQAEANAANAQHSTGPRTEAGKAAASQNAAQHGLTAKKFMLWGDEDPLLIAAIKTGLFDEWTPTTETQASLVEQLFLSIVQRDRCQRALDTVMYMTPDGQLVMDEKKSALLNRYYAMHLRHIRQTIALLRQLKADERKSNKINTMPQIGFVSQPTEPQPTDPLTKSVNPTGDPTL